MAVADVDRGRQARPPWSRVVVAPESGNVGVLLGNGDGTFQAVVTYFSGALSAESVAIADVNGDGKPDLVVANYCLNSNVCAEGAVGVLLGNGDGTFQAAVNYDSGASWATSVAVADVNGDGKPDVVVTNIGSPRDSRRAAGERKWDIPGGGDLRLGRVESLFRGGGGCERGRQARPGGVELRLLECVGRLGQCTAGKWRWDIPGGGDLRLGRNVNAFSVALGDFNGDGKPDVAVANGGLQHSWCAPGKWRWDIPGGSDLRLGRSPEPIPWQWGNSTATASPTWQWQTISNPHHPVGVLLNIPSFQKTTTTTITSSSNPSNFGQSVMFTATVTPKGSGTPTGTVTFSDRRDDPR